MKKMGVLGLAAVCAASVFAQDLVFSNQTITVRPEHLALQAVAFVPEAVVTNAPLVWSEVVQITTNGLFAGGGIVTNTVRQQVAGPVEIVATPAHWVADLVFELPRGYAWALNDYPVVIERFRTRIEVDLADAAVQGVFGASYPALRFAATTGAYEPRGPVRDGFLLLASQRLAGGQ